MTALGMRMRTLWRMRRGVLACAALGVLVAVWSVAKVSLFPPGLTPRALEMATASTQVVVDTRRSTLLDLRQDNYLETLTNRAVLLGNVMAIGQVRTAIAHRARIPAEALEVTPPLTQKQPRALAAFGNERQTTDILALNDRYRLKIHVNPTVPVLYLYSQTPTAGSAEALANAAVDAMRDYLRRLARSRGTPQAEQIRVAQLGQARGEVINAGVEWQVALLAFLMTFAASCATLIFASRVKHGWRLAALTERAAAR
jgi:hypothetical protein